MGRPNLLDDIFSESEQFLAATSASLRMRIAFGQDAGQKVRLIKPGFGYEEEVPLLKSGFLPLIVFCTAKIIRLQARIS